MESGEGSFKRSAPFIDDHPLNKKLHLDPFAQLEQAFLQKDLQENQEEDPSKERPLKNIQIQKTLSQGQTFFHYQYVPVRYQRTIKDRNQFGQNVEITDCLFRQIQEVLAQSETVVCGFSIQKRREEIIKQAIFFCLKDGQKILYICPGTSTRKKYKHLASKFQNVSIFQKPSDLTSLSTKVMVIAIQTLRKITFSHSDCLSQFNFAFFEIDDIEKGDLLEQLLITLPLNLQYFILIKPFSNIEEFSIWLSSLRIRPTHLFQPKQISPYPSIYGLSKNGSGLYLLLNKKGEIFQQNIEKFNEDISSAKVSKSKLDSHFREMAKLLYSIDSFPMLFFFRKKQDVEEYTRLLCQSFDFTSAHQKYKIQGIISNSLMLLSEQDRDNNLISLFLQILSRGIGMIHNGLLPILIEIVQILASEGLLSIIITNKTKNSCKIKSLIVPVSSQIITDGKCMKSKQIQELALFQEDGEKMIVIHSSDIIERSKLLDIFSQNQQKYSSSFKVSPYSLLNYHSFEDMDGEYVIERLFRQFQSYQLTQSLSYDLKQIEREANNIFVEDQKVKKLVDLKAKLKELESKLRKMTYTNEKLIPHLNIGRIVRLREDERDWGYGIVINFHKFQNQSKFKIQGVKYFIDVLVYIETQIAEEGFQPKPAFLSKDSILSQQFMMAVLTFDLECIFQITTVKLSYVPNNLLDESNTILMFETLKKLVSLNLSPIQIECIRREAFDLKQQIEQVAKELKQYSYLEPAYQQWLHLQRLKDKMKKIQGQIKNSQSLVCKKAFKGFNKLFKTLRYVQKGKLTLFGQAAACIDSPFSVLLHQLIREDFFTSLTFPEIAGLVASLVESSDSKVHRNKTKSLSIKGKFSQMCDKLKNILRLMRDSKIQAEEDVFLERLREDHIEIARRWCSGESFEILCNELQVFEGHFVDIMKGLSDLLSQMAQAAKVLNNNVDLSLSQIMCQILTQTVNLVNRGIVATRSLYDY